MIRFFTMLLMLGLFSSYVSASTYLAPPIKEDQLKLSNKGAYLGLGLELLPKELEAQLPEDVLIGQGVMVGGFASDSPAPKHGVKQFDILLNYAGVPIEHPKQLIYLIKKDKPGSKVILKIARQGKLIDIPVTLSAQNYPLDKDQLNYQFHMQTLGYHGYEIAMQSKNNFKVTIRFLAPDGVVRRRSFNGYYNQVMQDIRIAPDLSKYAKQKIMGIIMEKKDDEEGWFGDWMPFSDGVFDF